MLNLKINLKQKRKIKKGKNYIIRKIRRKENATIKEELEKTTNKLQRR